jgi:uncharacterized protein YcnI
MERRFFFGALAGLGSIFTLAAKDAERVPKPVEADVTNLTSKYRKLFDMVQGPASECTPAAYWDVHVDKGHYGVLYDALGKKVEGECIGANLVSGDVLKQALTPNNNEGFYTRSVYVERHIAPLKLVDGPQ